MKMKQIMAAAAAAGMLTFGAAFGASAAGIGYVNTNALMQAHPKMEKARLEMRTAAQKAEQDFESKSAGKSDQEKQQIAAELQKGLSEKNASLMGPIVKDIQKAIQQIRPHTLRLPSRYFNLDILFCVQIDLNTRLFDSFN